MIARARMAAGFTLLEVMVAVAILALSLTAIFSSEAGAIKMAARARKMGAATLLVRCKMGEIEEKIATEGLPAVYANGSDACCEEAPADGYTCDWEIDPIILPDNMFATTDPLDPKNANNANGTNSSGSNTPGSNTPGSNTPGSTTSPGSSFGTNPATSALSNTPGMTPGATPGMTPPMPGALGATGALGALGATGALGGATGATGATGANDPLSAYRNMDPTALLSGGGLGGLASMAMAFVYPTLKPAFEQQIRRATVTIHWKEGSIDHTFDVTQYIVADQPAQLTPEQMQQMQQTQAGMTGQTPGVGAGQMPGLGGQMPAMGGQMPSMGGQMPGFGAHP
jgi:general secretion pathway protein I